MMPTAAALRRSAIEQTLYQGGHIGTSQVGTSLTSYVSDEPHTATTADELDCLGRRSRDPTPSDRYPASASALSPAGAGPLASVTPFNSCRAFASRTPFASVTPFNRRNSSAS